MAVRFLMIAAASLLGAGAATAQSFESEKILFQDVTGTIAIRTTNGDGVDVAVEDGADPAFNVRVFERDGVVVIEGPRWTSGDRDCCNDRVVRTENLRRDRTLSTGPSVDEALFADAPTITVGMPVDGAVEFVDARMRLDMERLDGRLVMDACYVYGETDDLGEAAIGVVHGSRLAMGDVAAGVEIDVSGDADVLVGDVPTADIDIAGPGDVILGDVDGMLDVSIAGSGVARATRVDGPVTVRIAGSGGLAVKEGRADGLKATIDGSGGVYFGGRAERPDLRIYGSGEVRMRSTRGRVKKVGGGTVYVGDKIFDAGAD